jgi:phenylacetate-CoA ligase
MTEMGPVTFECPIRCGVLHVMESAYIPEVVDPRTTLPVVPGEHGELVLTNLGRAGSPLLRYRTGDLVCPSAEAICGCGRFDLALPGGILGRTDDMVVVRGVKVYPSAVEEIVRAFPEILEYRVEIDVAESLRTMTLVFEPRAGLENVPALAHRLDHALRAALSIRVHVKAAEPGTLERFEMKSRRWQNRGRPT